jgi:hypothetical protein
MIGPEWTLVLWEPIARRIPPALLAAKQVVLGTRLVATRALWPTAISDTASKYAHAKGTLTKESSSSAFNLSAGNGGYAQVAIDLTWSNDVQD